MADIELVVKIPEEMYKKLLNKGKIMCLSGYEGIIANGTPLPKGHGRLIDADEIIRLTNEIGAEDREEEMYHLFLKTVLTDAPAIIEADKEQEE